MTLCGHNVDPLFEQLENREFPLTHSQTLQIRDYYQTWKALNRLVTLFPSLKELSWDELYIIKNSSMQEQDEEEEMAVDVSPWARHLSILKITGYSSIWMQMLGQNMFQHLVHLTLFRQHSTERDAPDKLAQSPLLDALLNAPLVEYLHIGEFIIQMEAMERLHQNAPRLHTLLLESNIFEEKQDAELFLINGIQPAVNIIQFKILGHLTTIGGDQLGWIDYFSRKYAHVHDFSMEAYISFSDHFSNQGLIVDNTITRYDYVTLKLLEHLEPGSLKALHLKDKPPSHIIFEKMQEKNIQLTSLEFGYPLRTERIVKCLEALCTSTQVLSIQSLSLRSLSASHDVSLYELTRLKTLKLHYTSLDLNNTVYLDALILGLPLHLEHLSIDAHRVNCNYSYLVPNPSPSSCQLVRLELRVDDLESHIVGFLRERLVGLKQLVLNFRFLHSPYLGKDTTELGLYLNEHHLDYLEISTIADQAYPCKVVTDNKTMWYLPMGARRCYKRSWDEDTEKTNDYHFLIQCKSIKQIMLKVK
jgi:hypothetical protein